jgi:hypothetical protein
VVEQCWNYWGITNYCTETESVLQCEMTMSLEVRGGMCGLNMKWFQQPPCDIILGGLRNLQRWGTHRGSILRGFLFCPLFSASYPPWGDNVLCQGRRLPWCSLKHKGPTNYVLNPWKNELNQILPPWSCQEFLSQSHKSKLHTRLNLHNCNRVNSCF